MANCTTCYHAKSHMFCCRIWRYWRKISWYRSYIRSDVVNFTYHKWPADPKLAEIWPKQVATATGHIFNPSPGDGGTYVSSNHFPLRRKPWKPQSGLSIWFYDRLWLSPKIVHSLKYLFILYYFLQFGPHGVPALIIVRLGLGQEAALLLLLKNGVVAVRINVVKLVHVEQ